MTSLWSAQREYVPVKRWSARSPVAGGWAFANTKAVSLDGVNEYMTAAGGDVLGVAAADRRTWAFWIKIGSGSLYPTIWSKGSRAAGNKNESYIAMDATAHKLYLLLGYNGLQFYVHVTSDIALTLDTFEYWTITKNNTDLASGIKIYKSGSIVTTTTGSDTFSGYECSNVQTMRVACDFVDGVNAYFLPGSLNDFTMFNTDLTAAEVSELYNGGTSFDARTHTKAANLMAYWVMGDYTGDSTAAGGRIYDVLGNANNDLLPTNMEAADIVAYP